jgi:hypothetical protein
VKLSTHLRLVLGSRMVELYFNSFIRLHAMVLNYLTPEIILVLGDGHPFQLLTRLSMRRSLR